MSSASTTINDLYLGAARNISNATKDTASAISSSVSAGVEFISLTDRVVLKIDRFQFVMIAIDEAQVMTG